MTSVEKRKFRRVPMVAKIEAETRGKQGIVEARNISVGGMLLRAAETLAEGQTIRLHFTLPGSDQEIIVQGTVQHVSPGAFMGVRFDGLDPQALAAIEGYVNRTPETS